MLCDPGVLHPEPLPLRQTTADSYFCRRHSNTQRQVWLSLCGLSGSWAHKILFEPSKHLWRVWDLILNVIMPLLPSCWGFFFARGHGVSFFGGIQHSPVDGCSAVSYNFGVLTGEDELTSFYFTILRILLYGTLHSSILTDSVTSVKDPPQSVNHLESGF